VSVHPSAHPSVRLSLRSTAAAAAGGFAARVVRGQQICYRSIAAAAARHTGRVNFGPTVRRSGVLVSTALDDVATPVSRSSDAAVDRGPIRFYHLVIVGVVGFTVGATVVWLLFMRLGPVIGGDRSPPGLKPPAPGAEGAGSPRGAAVNGGGRFAKYHLPLPVYPRSSATMNTYTATQTTDRPAPPIDVRQYFHDPLS